MYRAIPLLCLAAACNRDYVPCEATSQNPALDGAAPRDLLVISVDTTRRDRIGRYGGPAGDGSARTPFIDGLLDQGLTLDNHRSCSNWTFASFLCLMTGRSNLETGIAPESDTLKADPLPAGTTGWPTWLGVAGFQTSLVSGNFFTSERYGFDAFYQHLDTSETWVAETVTERGLDAAGALDPAQPWLLHVHYVDPHLPYNPPARYLAALDDLEPIAWDLTSRDGIEALGEAWAGLGEAERALTQEHLDARYDAEVRYIDDQIAALHEGLEALGLLEEAAVLLWTDHGEQLLDRGRVGHRKDLHDEEAAALASLSGPGVTPRAFGAPTTHADIAATIMALFGLPIPSTVSGTVVGDGSGQCPRYAESMAGEDTEQSVDTDGLRLIYEWGGGLSLFDLAADPGESRDLAGERPDDVEALWELLSPRVDALTEIYDVAEPTPPDL